MQTNAPGLGKVTLTYIGFYLGMAIAINLLLWAAERFAGITISPGAVGWLPLILGAMMAGQSYGNKAGAKPPQSFSWMAGLVFTIVSIVLSVVLLYIVALAMGIDVNLTLSQLRAEMGDDGGLIAAILGGFLLFLWVIQRFSFSTGAKQGAALAEKQAAARAK